MNTITKKYYERYKDIYLIISMEDDIRKLDQLLSSLVNINSNITNIENTTMVDMSLYKRDISALISTVYINPNYMKAHNIISLSDIELLYTIGDICYCPIHNKELEEKIILIKVTSIIYEIMTIYYCSDCDKYIINEKQRIELENNIGSEEKKYIDFVPLLNDNIAEEDILVIAYNKKCIDANHNLIDVIITIPYVSNNGMICQIEINGCYCPECNRYIVLRNDYKKIPGNPLCLVINQTEESVFQKFEWNIKDKKESILSSYGYTVKKNSKLSERQRQNILVTLVENKILEKHKILSSLDTLICRGEKIHSWNEATDKWKIDRDYIGDYRTMYEHILIRPKSFSLGSQRAKIIKLEYFDEVSTAGHGNFISETLPSGFIEIDVNDIIGNYKNASFSIKVSGNSMVPKIFDEDFVLVDNTVDPKNGDICVCLLNKDSYIKQYYNINNMEKLVSINKDPQYKDIIINREIDDFLIQGVVIGRSQRGNIISIYDNENQML